jgi:DNA-directed RNA polymerase subunit RPC12/RpoP
MKINCLSCGHNIELDDAYGDYEGEIRCWTCSTKLALKTEHESIKSVRLSSQRVHPQPQPRHGN